MLRTISRLFITSKFGLRSARPSMYRLVSTLPPNFQSAIFYRTAFTLSLSRRCASTLPTHKTVNLPNLSPTMETGNIQSWSKNEGDKLDEGDVLCQIETDKAVMAMETPYTGFLAKILYPAGTKGIATNKPIAIIVKKKEDVGAFKNYTVESGQTETVKTIEKPKETETKPVISVDTISSPSSQVSSVKVPGSNHTLASPYAKKLAKDTKIDLATVKGSGPNGRIVSNDLKDVKKTISAVPLQDYIDVEITSMRMVIAKRLLTSKTTTPHFHITVDIFVDKLMSLRKSLNDELKGICKISINDFIIKASALALLKVPECNSQWLGTHIRTFKKTDISVGVATDSGLLTPIVFDASSKSISTISQEMKILAEKAKNNSLTLAEFQGGTFTVSNLGMFGVSDFTAIINPPQSCILSVGSVQKIFNQIDDSEPCFKSIMKVTLGCDHRVVDGAIGARWLQEFKNYIEKPMTLLI